MFLSRRMSDPLAITDEEAEGLARLAQAQLKLALRLSERALDEPDAETAGRLARASERVARGYRQSLLLKSRLKRDRDAAAREAAENPRPRTPHEQARVHRRIEQIHAAVEAVVCERVDLLDEDIDDALAFAADILEAEGADPDFLSEPLEDQVARVCAALDLPPPAGPPPAPTPAPAPPNSS